MARSPSIRVPYARIEWRDGAPFSPDFDDVYFQIEDGLNESRYVFLNASNASLKMREEVDGHLTIIETGFGSGLNFLTTYQAWKALPEPKRPLEFVSFEAYPLSPQDLEIAHSLWPELAHLSSKLRQQYPLPITGSHCLEFEEGAVNLTLIFGDLETSLSRNTIQGDVWYLDGFAPASNDSMWLDSLFDYIASHSSIDATVSTFTAAGFVKRGLQRAGFVVKKIKGFGKKREMLVASRSSERQTHFEPQHDPKSENLPQHDAINNQQYKERWFVAPPSNEHKSRSRKIEKAIVVGAGLAGLNTALALAKKGVQVKILEKNTTPVAEGSGQNQLVMYGKYPAEPNQEARFTLASHLHSQSFYEREQGRAKTSFWNPCGVLQLGWNHDEKSRHERILNNYSFPDNFCKWLTSRQTQTLTGIALGQPGLYFPHSGWLSPRLFAQHVLGHPLITAQFDTEIHSLQFDNNKQSWIAQGDDHSDVGDYAIICSANNASQLVPEIRYYIKSLRGQTTQIDASGLDSPSTVLCGSGYLCPAKNGEIHFGATYDLKNDSMETFEADNLENIRSLNEWLPEWAKNHKLEKAITTQRAGLRCTTSDYIPIIGPVHDFDAMLETFSSLRVNARKGLDRFGHFKPGLYLNIGHGSKGTMTTPLAAEYIASMILSRPPRVSDEYRLMCSPARFMIRTLKRNKPLPQETQQTLDGH